MIYTVFISLFLVYICFRLHCAILCQSAIYISKSDHSQTTNTLLILLSAFSAHLVEIILYAIVLYLYIDIFNIGHLSGSFDRDLVAYFYFSTVSFTSLGLGDIWPHGPVRIITGIEALNGLILIAWSASYTYLLMQKYWVNFFHTGESPENKS